MVLFDAALRVTVVNQAAACLAALPADTLIGPSGDALAGLPMFSGIVVQLREVLESRVAQRLQVAQPGTGTQRWFDVWIVSRGADGVSCFARDITAMNRTEDQRRESAGRDSLTGLLKHAAFHDAVSRALATSGAASEQAALVLFDLDYLKLINDVHGHQTGDQALRAVADVLRSTTREADRVARLGGDEFGALFIGVEREVVLRIAHRASRNAPWR